MSLFDTGLWSLWGGIHSQALLDQLWSTVSWSLVVLEMLVMMIMVLVGIGGKHFSISQSTGKFDAGRLEVIGPGAAAAAGRRN